MPGIIMHHHFGHVVYSALDEIVKDKMNRLDLFDLGLAGPDIFDKIQYFNKKKNPKYKATSFVFHTQDTKKFFLNLVKETKNNRELFPYLCGAVAHYYLDSLTNPFLYFQTGYYDPLIHNSLKYRGLKELLHQEIDAYCIVNYYGSVPTKFKIRKEVFDVKKLDISFGENFNNLYLNTYNLKDGFKLTNLAIKHSKKFYRKVYDPLGLKRRIFDMIY